MPIYEYHCPNCGADAEFIKPISEVGISIPCKSCGYPMSRKFSSPQICMKESRPHGYYPAGSLNINS